jgi:hypothetical protein
LSHPVSGRHTPESAAEAFAPLVDHRLEEGMADHCDRQVSQEQPDADNERATRIPYSEAKGKTKY